MFEYEYDESYASSRSRPNLKWVDITQPIPRKFIFAPDKKEALKILGCKRIDCKQLLRNGITV